MRLRSRFASSCVFLILVGCASSAPASHDGSQGSARNRASFDVEALREVANDWVTARLSVVSEGKDPSEIAKTVNETMAKAIEAAKRVPDVTVQSAAYVTQPVYDEGKVVRWRARQELRLESGDVDRLAKLIGRLQGESVQLSNIDFSVRRETRKALEDELIEEALGRFRSRATLVTKGMGSNNWSLIELSVGSSDGEPRRVMMEHRPSAMLSRSQSDTPVFEAGTSKLRVRVSGIVELD